MNNGYTLIGWREWVALPRLGIQRIKAKIDTGARTSVLHAFKVESFSENGRSKVQFAIHPRQNNANLTVTCVADLVDVRWIRDSGGHSEQRYIIQTQLVLAGQSHSIEVSLTNRDDMRFRMLLGRKALAGHYIIDCAASYLSGKLKK